MRWIWWVIIPLSLPVGMYLGSLIYLAAVWAAENEQRFRPAVRWQAWVRAKEKAIVAKAIRNDGDAR